MEKEKEYFIAGSLNEDGTEEIAQMYKVITIGVWARELARKGKADRENHQDKKIDKNLDGNEGTMNEEDWSGC